MYEKIKTWLKKINPCYVIITVLVCIIIFLSCLLFRSNIYDNGNTINDIRTELDRIEETKSDIAGTDEQLEQSTSTLEGGLNDLQDRIESIEISNSISQDASNKIDELIGECQSIIEQVRKQHE